jgi:alpha-tubulin suppressor-like RCC1 family protein
MNKTMNSMIKRITVRLLLAACPAYVTMQPFAAFAASANLPGTVTAWGYNGLGCLGNGTTTSSSKPVSVILPSGVTASAIAAGQFHNMAITDDGLYQWGDGITTPMKVAFPATVTTVIAAAGGMYHSLALTDDGVYAWGGNGSGQLGNGTTTDSTTPVEVIFPSTVTTVTAIAAGSYHSMAITDDGLYTWGDNDGQLGDGTFLSRSLPVKVTFPSTVTTIVAISGGGFHSLAITDDGVYAWGNNTFGQLGDGTTAGSLRPTKVIFQRKPAPTMVTAIAAGFWHSLAIGDNSVYGWGYNGNGELGAITGATTTVPVKVIFPKKTPVLVTAIAAGSMHSLALTDNGLYAWGNNSSGQLGIQGANSLTPAMVQAESNVIGIGAGYYHSLALH